MQWRLFGLELCLVVAAIVLAGAEQLQKDALKKDTAAFPVASIELPVVNRAGKGDRVSKPTRTMPEQPSGRAKLPSGCELPVSPLAGPVDAYTRLRCIS